MRRFPLLVAFLSVAFVGLGTACVDLFHSTEWCTLGDTSCKEGGAGLEGGDLQDSGEDAARPHEDFCKMTSAEALAAARKACAWLGACEGVLAEQKFGQCVIDAQLAFDCKANPSLRPLSKVDTFWACMKDATTCKAVDDCVFPSGKPSCSKVDSGTFTTCQEVAQEGLVQCTPAGTNARACIGSGQLCSKYNDSVSHCANGVDGGCVPASPRCTSTKVVDCREEQGQTYDHGFDCAYYGAGACTVAGSSVACAPGPKAPACSDDSGIVTCNGNVATVCVGKKRIAIDCGALGLPCDDSAPAPPFAPQNACVIWDSDAGAPRCASQDDTCSGFELSTCARGAIFAFDCREAGLGKCKLTNGLAACTRP